MSLTLGLLLPGLKASLPLAAAQLVQLAWQHLEGVQDILLVG